MTSTSSSLSSPSLQDSASRWSTFRQMNRNRPLQQLRVGCSVGLAVCLYLYALLFLSSPQYDLQPVLLLNNQRHLLYIQRQEEYQQHIQSIREKRLNSTRIRNQEWQAEQQQRRNNIKQYRNATNNSTRTTTTENKQPVSEWVVFVRFLSSFLMMTSIFAMTRMLVVYYIRPNLVGTRQPARRQPQQPSRDARQAAFRAWAARLNAQRAAQGERPLSLESLRVVLRNRDLTGNDYEQLLRFDEEAGVALFQSMGATREEIERCPRRILQEGDDLLRASLLDRPPPHCAVCLEPYQLNEQVRTIPCFHTFHVQCIDNWLERKAACPICKHPAVG